MKQSIKLLATLFVITMVSLAFVSSSDSSTAQKEKVYCKYCGYWANSVKTLTSTKCTKHPDGHMKGYHAPYKGAEKKQYTCEYCGYKANSIKALTSTKCPKHPKGARKGYHSPL